MNPLTLRVVVALCGLGLLAASACGGAGAAQRFNGYWLPADGGPGAVVFESQGEQLWLGRNITLERIALGLDFECAPFARSSDGLVLRSDTAFYRDTATPTANGALDLKLTLPAGLVDSQYRTRLSNEPSKIVGTVSATFSGAMALEGAQAVRVTYQVEYRDAEKVLSTEDGGFVAPRADACR